MSEIMVIDGFTIPAYAQNKAVENDFGRVGGFPTISMLSHTSFKIKVEDNERIVAAPVPIVILGVTPKGTALNRAYYANQYIEGSTDAPDCASSDGVVPDEGDLRQCDTCANCPHSVFGSSVTGKGQACAQGKTLFVVPAAKLDSIVYQVRVAPTSLKAVASYGAKLARAGLHPASVITQLGLVPETESLKSYPILKLELGGFLSEADGTQAIAKAESPEVLSMVVSAVALPAPTRQAEIAAKAEAARQAEIDAAAAAGAAKAEAEAAAQHLADTGFETQPGTVAQPQESVHTGVEAQTQTTPPSGTQVLVDSAGQPWDPKLHSSGKTFISDGTWKKRKGAAKAKAGTQQAPPPQQQATNTDTGSDPLSDVLKEWG